MASVSDMTSAMIINSLGEYIIKKTRFILAISETSTEYPNFEFVGDSDVGRGCSAVLMGQMMYFGGYPNTRQFSIIEKCKMKRSYPDMPFHFYDGSSNSFMESTKVLLCFSSFTMPTVDDCHT